MVAPMAPAVSAGVGNWCWWQGGIASEPVPCCRASSVARLVQMRGPGWVQSPRCDNLSGPEVIHVDHRGAVAFGIRQSLAVDHILSEQDPDVDPTLR